MQNIYVYLKKDGKPLHGTSCGISRKFDNSMIELSKLLDRKKQITYHIPKDNIEFIEITEPCK